VDRDGRSPEQVLNGSELSKLTGDAMGIDHTTRAGAQDIGERWQKEAEINATALSFVTGGVALGVRNAIQARPLAHLSTEALKSIIKENGGVSLLNANGLFGTGVNGAKNALQTLNKVPEGLKAEALNAYKEIAKRNIHAEVQQVRLQVIEKALNLLNK
jgi:hypothetical protein